MAKPNLQKQAALTQARLLELLHYDPATGVFTRRVAIGHRKQFPAGKIVGSTTDRGYRTIRVDGRPYYAHRLAALYMTGEWPIAGIDHKFGHLAGDRWENLRPATQLENSQNMIRSKRNTSGHKGVYQRRNKWVATISTGGKRRWLGTFFDAETAAEAYASAKAVLHTFEPTIRE